MFLKICQDLVSRLGKGLFTLCVCMCAMCEGHLHPSGAA